MSTSLPQPDQKVQPIRLIEQRETHEAEARAGGIDDLVEFRAVYTRDILLHAAVAGPEDGEPVVMLHGFPDFWLSWARQIRPLVDAGYRVIMPDQRGYNLSEKPGEIESYTIEELGTDITDVLDAFEIEKAHLVGHDWGGAVSWWLAENSPERFKTVSILNCPHYSVMVDALKLNNMRQMLRSWYIACFQIPFVPEKIASAGDYYFLEATLDKISGENAFTEAELEVYRKTWSNPDAVRSMMNWYRAGRSDFFKDEESREQEITVPVRVIWGKKDVALDVSLVEPSVARCRDGEVHWVSQGTHWVHRDCPDLVAGKLLETFEEARK